MTREHNTQYLATDLVVAPWEFCSCTSTLTVPPKFRSSFLFRLFSFSLCSSSGICKSPDPKTNADFIVSDVCIILQAYRSISLIVSTHLYASMPLQRLTMGSDLSERLINSLRQKSDRIPAEPWSPVIELGPSHQSPPHPSPIPTSIMPESAVPPRVLPPRPMLAERQRERKAASAERRQVRRNRRWRALVGLANKLLLHHNQLDEATELRSWIRGREWGWGLGAGRISQGQREGVEL